MTLCLYQACVCVQYEIDNEYCVQGYFLSKGSTGTQSSVDTMDVQPKRLDIGGVAHELWDLSEYKQPPGNLASTSIPKIVHVHLTQLSSTFVNELVSVFGDRPMDKLVVDMGQVCLTTEGLAETGDLQKLVVQELVLLGGAFKIPRFVIAGFLAYISVQESLVLSRVNIEDEFVTKDKPMVKKLTRMTLIFSGVTIQVIQSFHKLLEMHVLQDSTISVGGFQDLRNEDTCEQLHQVVFYQSVIHDLFLLSRVADVVCLQTLPQDARYFYNRDDDHGGNYANIRNLATDDVNIFKDMKGLKLDKLTLRNCRVQHTLATHIPTFELALSYCTLENKEVDTKTITESARGSIPNQQVRARKQQDETQVEFQSRTRNALTSQHFASFDIVTEDQLWEHKLWSRAQLAMELVNSLQCAFM